jgi:hypothetical protein
MNWSHIELILKYILHATQISTIVRFESDFDINLEIKYHT